MKKLILHIAAAIGMASAPLACQGNGALASIHRKSQGQPVRVAQKSMQTKRFCGSYDEFLASSAYPSTLSVWKNESLMQAKGDKRLRIHLGMQRGVCLVDGQVAMDFPVCTGTSKHPTPVGSFCITDKDATHWSNLYDCPMPYFMRLTNSGIGLHVGEVFRQPASHGCIRMTREACIPIFQALPYGAQVEIVL